MSLSAFISYSHADEKHLDRLHKHMALLTRDGVFETWTDHVIIPGQKLDDTVFGALRSSNIFIALLSADYIASNYCYEREFKEALELEEKGKLHIVPVILEPCDWLSSPFRQFMALPKEGKAISEWTNENVAYLNVVEGLRRVAESGAVRPSGPTTAVAQPSAMARRVKIKQEFDSIQRRDFADQAFAVIRDYFRTSCAELAEMEDLRTKFENMGENAFTCTVVNRGIRSGRDAHITVHNSKGGRHHMGDISYVFEAHAESGTSNGSIQVDADDYNMYLSMNAYSRNEDAKYDAKQAAEVLWLEFTGHAGIEYD